MPSPDLSDAARSIGSAQVLGRIRLRHLQCFLAVARLGTLRRAAEALAVTQPAVTKTLNELEELLGTPLFVRGRRGATLTAQAAVFLRHANASVNALTLAVDSVSLDARRPSMLRLGMLPTVAPFVADVHLRYLEAGGDAAARVTTGRNTELADLLRAGELDLVVGRLADPDAMVGLTFEHLFGEPMLIALHPAHPIAGRRRPSAAELSSWPFVLPVQGTLIRQVADGFLARQGIAPRQDLVETLDASLARALLAAGRHLWITPASAAWADIRSGALKRLPTTITPDEPVGLVSRTDTLPSAAIAGWIRVAREVAEERRNDNQR